MAYQIIFYSTDRQIIQVYNNTTTTKNIKMSTLLGPLLLTSFNLIPAWISNYIHYNVWDEITYPFLNFNGATVEV